jgi:large subunit ribosomal protein L15
MDLNTIKKSTGFVKSRKRVGRGSGSGKGFHTTGTGTKGQKSRTGHSHKFGFEGGQTPFYKKLPQIVGFTNPRSKDIAVVSLSVFEKFEDNSEITPEVLIGVTLKSLPKYGVKILGNGNISKKLIFKDFKYSTTAKEKILSVGGKIE